VSPAPGDFCCALRIDFFGFLNQMLVKKKINHRPPKIPAADEITKTGWKIRAKMPRPKTRSISV